MVAAGGPGAAATAQQQEDWLLAGWERSQYDDKPGPSLGVIINPDRVVVVTGVSSGIGAAIARVLAGRGCHVFGRRGPALRHKISSSVSTGCCPRGLSQVACAASACCRCTAFGRYTDVIHSFLSQDACAIIKHAYMSASTAMHNPLK